ncbi:SMI1/KNR4 family protein [Flagellimonas sp.]|uniref:SMI1/KNR4 family protein n=1 Tax=Flagellimonas sp. TaxID=2058762 RepID=UPI003F49C96F
MSNFSGQIARIKTKLIQAKQIDSDFKVFGSGGHKYILGKPAASRQIEEFEAKYAICLPKCYKTFIGEIGNGGEGYRNSAAGPFYGIFPLGEGVEELLYSSPQKYLGKSCILRPEINQNVWGELTKKLRNEGISDKEYSAEINKLYSGVLPIGSQGCAFLHGIVLNGPYQGRMVNLSMDLGMPRFAKDFSFLDWYERWLDELIDGSLFKNPSSWFGYETSIN